MTRRQAGAVLRAAVAAVAAAAVPAAVAVPGGAAAAQSAGIVRGAVGDEQEQPAAGALVILIPLDGGGAAIEAETDADGRFARTDVPPGLYAVTAAIGDRRSEMYRIRVRDGGTVGIRFALAPGRRVTPWVAADDVRGERDALFAAGVAANRAGAHDDAVTYFTLATGIDPACLECHYNAGVAWSALAQWTDAEQAFEAALALRPDYPAGWYGLANVYARSDRPADADAARAEATRLTLASIDAARQAAAADVERGLAARAAGDLDTARRRFEEAASRGAGHAPASYWLGVTLTELGQPAAAAAALRRALALDDDGPHAADARTRLAALEARP